MTSFLQIKALFFLIILSNSINAQNDIDKILNLQTRPNNRNGYCVQTIFNSLNNSSFYLQDFLDKEIKLSEVGEPDFKLKNGIGTIKTTYIKSIIHGYGNIDVNAYKVYVQYSVFPIDNDFFVEKLDIWGNWESVASIFISYYPTTLNVEYLKNNKSEMTSYYIEDRAVFSSEMVGGRLIGRIKVRSTSGKDYKQFLNDYEIKKQVYNSNLEIEIQDSIKKVEEEKQIEIKKEIERKRIEEEKLKVFLFERKTKIYDFSEINKTGYNNLLTQIQKESNSFLESKNSTSFFITGIIKIDIDTNNVVKYNTESIKTDNQEQLSKLIQNFNNSINVKAQQVNGYFVNSTLTYNINILYQTGQTIFKIDKSHNFIFSEPYPTDMVKNEIENKYQNSDIGKYSVKYEIFSNENIPTSSNITLIKYKKSFKFPYYYFGIAALIAAGLLGL
jgi:hypothetical protein